MMNDTNDTNGKTWARSEFGETFHSFSPSGTAICRKNIRWSSYASVHPEYLRTEAEVDQVVDASLGYRKCVNCATKEQQHRDRKAASMAPVNPLDQVCEGVLPETVETETPAETVDMDDLHTQALAEDVQRRIRTVAQQVATTFESEGLVESVRNAAKALEALATELSRVPSPIEMRAMFDDENDAMTYLSQFEWEATELNRYRRPNDRITVRRIYPPQGEDGLFSVGYDITGPDHREVVATVSSFAYLYNFLNWYRPVRRIND